MKNLIVFGSSGALGNMICNHLQAFDYKLVRVDVRGEADKLADVTIEEDVSRVFDQLQEENIKLDGLINLVGKIHNRPFYNLMTKPNYIETHDWIDQFNVNVHSAFFIAKHYHRYCTIFKLKCNLINISSISACGNPGQIAYSSSKAALEVMTQTLAKELGPFGHRFNVIAPGFIDVETTRTSLPAGKINDIEARTPLRKLGDIESIVNGVHYLLSSDFTTGQVLKVDGGLKL